MLKNITVLNFITIVFIVLKLCNIINWSWFLVLLPTIINVGIYLLLYLVVGIIKMKTRIS